MRAHGCIALALLTLIGCNGTPRPIEPERYTDAFGDEIGQPITEESVGEMQMLHRRALLELYGKAVIPIESNFEVSAGIGVKGEIEVAKNVFLGVGFDYIRMQTDETVSGELNDPAALPGTDPAALYSKLDRYNILALFDYDTRLTRDFIYDGTPLDLRAGIGVGLTIVDGDASDNGFISDFDIEPYFGFLLRPSVELVWRFSDSTHLSTTASYDFIPRDNIDIDFLSERRQVEDSIDFSSFNIGMGFVFEF